MIYRVAFVVPGMLFITATSYAFGLNTDQLSTGTYAIQTLANGNDMDVCQPPFVEPSKDFCINKLKDEPDFKTFIEGAKMGSLLGEIPPVKTTTAFKWKDTKASNTYPSKCYYYGFSTSSAMTIWWNDGPTNSGFANAPFTYSNVKLGKICCNPATTKCDK